MSHPLSLLVVDVSEDLEEVLKGQERGYLIDWECMAPWGYVRSKQDANKLLTIQYPHGSVRAGLNAIIDTTRIANERKVPTYAVHLYTGNSDGEEQTCFSLQQYIPKENQYEKGTNSAFRCRLADRLKADGCQHLMVLGYDRDFCVLETVKDAVLRGITVVTSEQCMLTKNLYDKRESSLAYFREHTVFLETLVDVWNYICKATAKPV